MKKNNIIKKMRYDYFKVNHIDIIAKILAMININKILFPCLEIPITTMCTLCCKDCSNLIQYYEKPYMISSEEILFNLNKLVESIDGISCLRILGGEPLLSPALYDIIRYSTESVKIKNILIVTNGTMLFSNDCISILENNPKIKIFISDYGLNSKMMFKLEEQLLSYNILYDKRKVLWRDKANVKFRGKNDKELVNSFSMCPNRFFSLLRNELHMCPRSAHGTDLKIIPKKKDDFIKLEQLSRNTIRRAILVLLKRPYINACNFCDEDISGNLPIIESGKQCSKSYAIKVKQNIVAENRKEMSDND